MHDSTPFGPPPKQVNVFADESRHNKGHRHMVIGGLWIRPDAEGNICSAIARWRAQNNCYGEMKFTKCRPGYLSKYKQFVDFFFDFESPIRFNCITVDSKRRDDKVHSDGDQELGFYKFYFLLLSRRLVRGNNYSITLDRMNNKKASRLDDLLECLNNWAYSNRQCLDPVRSIRPMDSKKHELLQLTDLLTGAVSCVWNGGCDTTTKAGAAKQALADHVLIRGGIRPGVGSPRTQRPFNVWHWTPRKNN